MFGKLRKNVRFGDSLPQSVYHISASSSCPFYHSVSQYTRCSNSANDRSLFVNFNGYSIDLSCRNLMLRSIQAEQYKIKKAYFIDEALTLDPLVFSYDGCRDTFVIFSFRYFTCCTRRFRALFLRETPSLHGLFRFCFVLHLVKL